tara:strand:- start:208 stop:468 length:261 start_codon:yes stop_codon:yes gene_type:complete
MSKEIAKKILDDEMSEYTSEHINKVEELEGWIINAMIEYSKKVSKIELLHPVTQCTAQDYARFCVECDREKLPMLCFSDWYKQYGG